MIRLRRIARDERGSAIVETAFALPAFIVLLWAVVQLGLVLRAMAGIQHALGEGARAATLFPYNPPSTTNLTIYNAMNEAVHGIGPGNFVVRPPQDGIGNEDGSDYLDLQVTYNQDTDLIFLPGPTVSVTRSKRVWVAEVE